MGSIPNGATGLLKLEEITGLGDGSPLHKHLKLVDEFLKHEQRWSEIHRRVPERKLVCLLWEIVGHPVEFPLVTLQQIELLRDRLVEEGETKLAGIVEYLSGKLYPHEIRITMMFILVNLEHLKVREGGCRTIDSGWLEE